MSLRMREFIFAIVICVGFSSSSVFGIVLDFETEDDFVTPLVNGQIVDPVFDPVDIEFGNFVDIYSTKIGGGSGHLGVTVFDSTIEGINSGGEDHDLMVGLGNILVLQNNAHSATTLDATYGLCYDKPNDEAGSNDAGSIVFDFLTPVELHSIDLIDIDGGVTALLTITDNNGKQRVYDVGEHWTTDITVSGDGWETLDLTTTLAQAGDNGGGPAVVILDEAGFDRFSVVSLDVAFTGRSPSAALDNLAFVPEPATIALLGLGLIFIRKRKS